MNRVGAAPAPTSPGLGRHSGGPPTPHGVYMLQLAVQKGAEWNLPLAVASMEVRSAFDEVLAEKAADALPSQGAPLPYVTGIIKVVVGNQGRPSVGR